jgi:ribonuclease BN (tRNA processing enzyme)
VQLTILGCSGTFPGPMGPCSSYLLESDGFRLLLDVGNGALGPLQARVGLLGVDAVLLSHLHGDHCLDLIAYSYARRYHPDGPLTPLPVYGPRDTQQRLCGAFEDWPEDALCDVYEFRDLTPGRRAIGPFSVEMDRVSHPIEAYAFRITADGRTITYSGDSGSSGNLDRLAAGSDLFLCEASWHDSPRNPPGVHMSGREAGETATRAEARHLVLTHIVPWADPPALFEEASGAFSGQITLAQPGLVFDL